MFVLASYGMTKVFTPEGLDMTARLNVTITGPLYLLSVVQPDEGHIRQQADEDEEPEEEGSGAESVPPRQGAAAPIRGPPGMAALKSMYGTFLPNKGFPAATPPAASPPSRPPGM